MIEMELFDPQATEQLGVGIAALMSAGDVVLLVGDLGAGKTTLVRGFVRGLGGKDEVTSPTFALRHEYATDPPLTHVDCWRLGSTEELDDLGLDEVLDDGGVLVIEWGRLAEWRFGADALHVSLADGASGTTRVVRLDFRAPRWVDREHRLSEWLRSCGVVFAVSSSDVSAP